MAKSTQGWVDALRKFRTSPILHVSMRGGRTLLAEQVSTGYEAVNEVIDLRRNLEAWQRDLLEQMLTIDDVAANRRCGEVYDRITRMLSHGRAACV